MSKSFCIIRCIVVLPFFAFSQTNIKGIVLNKKTNEAIPFANLLLTKSRLVSHSDEKGQFSVMNVQPADTLVVSSIGFENQKIVCGSTDGFLRIEMNEASYSLFEINVSEKDRTKRDFHRVGGFYNKHHKNFATKNYPGFQFAEYMPNEIGPGCRLEKVKLCFMSLISNDPCVDIRIRIQEVDPVTGLPGNDLLQNRYLISPGTGNYEADVKSENLMFPANGVFVSVEWVDTKNKLNGKLPTVGPYLRWSGSKDHECRTYVRRPGGKWILDSFKKFDRAEKMNAIIWLEFSTIRKKD